MLSHRQENNFAAGPRNVPLFANVRDTIVSQERLQSLSYAILNVDHRFPGIQAYFSVSVLNNRFDEAVQLVTFGMYEPDKSTDPVFREIAELWNQTFFRAGLDFFIGDLVLDNKEIVQEKAEEKFGMTRRIEALLAGVPLTDIV